MTVNKQRGFSIVEFILVALTVGLLVAIIMKNYAEAVLVERRSIAQQGVLTVAGLQERWFIRMHEYANSIDQVGGAGAAGEYYRLRITQDPCGNTSCFTVTATATGEQEDDVECERMTLTNLGVKKAYSRKNEDTSAVCWKTS